MGCGDYLKPALMSGSGQGVQYKGVSPVPRKVGYFLINFTISYNETTEKDQEPITITCFLSF